jgi:repressor LexA
MRTPPTGRRGAVLAAVRDSIDQRGYPPTVRELAATVGLSSYSTVAMHLARLEANGWIRRDPGSPRAITVLDPQEAHR